MVKLALHRTSPRPDAARLPKTWSTMHETAWEWLWTTIAHNLGESTSKARGSLGTATATAAHGSRSIDRPPLTRVSTAGHLPGEGLQDLQRSALLCLEGRAPCHIRRAPHSRFTADRNAQIRRSREKPDPGAERIDRKVGNRDQDQCVGLIFVEELKNPSAVADVRRKLVILGGVPSLCRFKNSSFKQVLHVLFCVFPARALKSPPQEWTATCCWSINSMFNTTMNTAS